MCTRPHSWSYFAVSHLIHDVYYDRCRFWVCIIILNIKVNQPYFQCQPNGWQSPIWRKNGYSILYLRCSMAQKITHYESSESEWSKELIIEIIFNSKPNCIEMFWPNLVVLMLDQLLCRNPELRKYCVNLSQMSSKVMFINPFQS